MKILLAYRFSPLIVADTAVSKFYFIFISDSLLNSSTISNAPVLID